MDAARHKTGPKVRSRAGEPVAFRSTRGRLPPTLQATFCWPARGQSARPDSLKGPTFDGLAEHLGLNGDLKRRLEADALSNQPA